MAQKNQKQYLIAGGIILVLCVVIIIIFADGDGAEAEIADGFQGKKVISIEQEKRELAVVEEEIVMCPTDTRKCADGSTIERMGNDCHFPSCPKKDE